MSAISPPLSFQQLNFTAWGAPLPLITGTQSYTPAFYVALSGSDMLLFSFLFNVPGFACIRIKQDGTSCIYLSTNYKKNFNLHPPAMGNFSAVQQISSTNFVLNNGNGGIYYFVLPSFFAPGATFIVPEVDFTPPSPCGVGALQASFYDAINNLSAYEFVQPFPDASNIYASIYKGAYSGASLLTGGFIGNFPNGTDGFNRTSLALPPYVSNFSGISDCYYYTRGGIAFQNVGASGLPYQTLGFSGLRINNGATLVCGGNGTTQSYVETVGAYTIYLKNYPLLQSGTPNNLTTQNTSNNGVVDSPNAIAVCGESCVWAFSPNQVILFWTGGLAYIVAGWIVGNYLVVAIGNRNNPNPASLALYRAPIENFAPYLGPLPPRPLYNYARGVPIHANAPRFSGFRKSRIIL